MRGQAHLVRLGWLQTREPVVHRGPVWHLNPLDLLAEDEDPVHRGDERKCRRPQRQIGEEEEA